MLVEVAYRVALIYMTPLPINALISVQVSQALVPYSPTFPMAITHVLLDQTARLELGLTLTVEHAHLPARTTPTNTANSACIYVLTIISWTMARNHV